MVAVGSVVTNLMAADAGLSSTLLDDTDPSPLFKPVDVAGLHLRNRLVMAPMTRQFSPGGVPGDEVAAYYRRRASSLGLLITEGTYVDHPSAGGSDRVPRFYGADALAAWREVAARSTPKAPRSSRSCGTSAPSASPGRRPSPARRSSAPRAWTRRAARSANRPARGRSPTSPRPSRGPPPTPGRQASTASSCTAPTAISSTSSTGPPPTAATMTTAARSPAGSGSAPRSRPPSGPLSARTSRSRSASRSGRAATTTPGSPRPRTSWRPSSPRW